MSSDGKTAYYASDRSDTKGGLDIYTFELREDVRPLKTLWVINGTPTYLLILHSCFHDVQVT